DSRVIRELLVHIIGLDPRLEVAGAVETAEDALQVLDRLSPDVISMDIRLPGMSGLDATEKIMRIRPTPIVVVSASGERDDLHIAINALRAGALTVVEKPVSIETSYGDDLAKRVCTQLAIMSQVKVVRRRTERLALPHAEPSRRQRPGGYRVLAITSST